MTGTLVFSGAMGITFILLFYAAKLLRQLYLAFCEDHRVAQVGARGEFDLFGSRTSKIWRRLHAHVPTNDNDPATSVAISRGMN
jgi:hypothetical protein